MAWNAWGVAEAAHPLPEQVRTLLGQALGVEHRDTPSVAEADVVLEPVVLPAAARAALEAAVGASGVDSSDATRLRHAGGRSTPDLLRRRGRAPQAAPDAVVAPGSVPEVQAVLAVAVEHDLAVVPFGGGTGVVGGVDPVRADRAGVVCLDLHRFDRLLALDEVSGTATLEAGLRGPQAESLLRERGFSLGHYPQSFRHATVGGFAATRSSGQASAGHGRFDDMVEALTLVTPRGVLAPGRAPGSAAGPDLTRLVLGSEGTLGVITDVTVRVHRVPEVTRYAGWSFPDLATGADALRTLAQSGSLPTVVRLSDEVETAMNLALAADVGGASPAAGGCLAVTTVEGTTAHADARHAEVTALLRAAGGTPLGEAPARGWEAGRFDAPHLRDALLDVNAVAETLETATTWSRLHALKAAVTTALVETLTAAGTPPLVMAHVSHVYPAGASLYLTVVFARGDDPAARWAAAKTAAGDAIAAAGATITHHHAVGRDHRPWMRAEVGDLGLDVLRAVKDALDPAGVCNPGVLIP
ncbi:FAD-binding oxidoreductase [Rhodococcus aerolatus]